jgi:hypothetical protein
VSPFPIVAHREKTPFRGAKGDNDCFPLFQQLAALWELVFQSADHSAKCRMFFRLLPWEYAIRNLFRRPLRTSLTFAGLTTVIVLVFVVVGFIRGLERSLAVSGDPRTAVVFSLGMGENLEYSSIPMRTSDLVPASVRGIQERAGVKYVSPELYLGTQMEFSGREGMGLVRGVTQSALLVRGQLELESGDWPQTGEVMVGVPRCLGHDSNLSRAGASGNPGAIHLRYASWTRVAHDTLSPRGGRWLFLPGWNR